jgi:hypothetical protein
VTGRPQPEPFTAVQEAAVQLHELFRTFRTSGFSERQALDLVGKMMTAAAQQGAEAPPCPKCGYTAQSPG